MTEMPRHYAKHVNRQFSKGREYFYFRKGKGPRIPLPGQPGTPEFEAAYAAALTGEALKLQAARPALETPGTIGALIVHFKKNSPRWAKLRGTTKIGYSRRLEILRREHGHRTLSGLTPSRIESKILLPYIDRPGEALNLLKILRVLIKYACKLGWLKFDPSFGVDRPKLSEVRSWTDDEIRKFETHWPLGTKERLAFALHLYTGQRRSDVHRMTWADVTVEKIAVVQQKTGTKLKIHLHSDLKAVLAAAPREHVAILTTVYGKPFTVTGFSNFMREAIRAAGLPEDCRAHGLRKAAGRRLAEALCSPHEIMAVLGHKSLAEAERYTRGANQARLAESAIAKQERQDENRNAQTDVDPFGETPKTRGQS
jgi:enterobacteria phage integrase